MPDTGSSLGCSIGGRYAGSRISLSSLNLFRAFWKLSPSSGFAISDKRIPLISCSHEKRRWKVVLAFKTTKSVSRKAIGTSGEGAKRGCLDDGRSPVDGVVPNEYARSRIGPL